MDCLPSTRKTGSRAICEFCAVFKHTIMKKGNIDIANLVDGLEN